jgi:hypothetical protein
MSPIQVLSLELKLYMLVHYAMLDLLKKQQPGDCCVTPEDAGVLARIASRDAGGGTAPLRPSSPFLAGRSWTRLIALLQNSISRPTVPVSVTSPASKAASSSLIHASASVKSHSP